MNGVWIAALIAALFLLFLMRKTWFSPDRSRAAQLSRQYAVMTEQLLDAVPDDALVEAVIGNLLAKTDDKTLPAYRIIPALSQGRCAVYSVWLILCEQKAGSLPALCASADAGFVLLAADGLSLFGCERAADALRRYAQEADPSLLTPFACAIEQEAPADAMIAYIRDNPADFCD